MRVGVRKSSTPVLNTLSPTAIIWSRSGIASASAPGMSAANSWALPATSFSRPQPTLAREWWRRVRGLRSADCRGRTPRRPGNPTWSDRRNCGTCARSGSLTSASDGASSASIVSGGNPTPPPSNPSPPITTTERVRMFDRQERGNARAHGIAHHVGAFDSKMIEQRPHVPRHGRAVIGGGIVKLARRTMAAIVERDRAPAGARERRAPSPG